jgi:PTS system nitrogen regulatory IIA component
MKPADDVRLTDFLAPESIGLALGATEKDAAFEELVALLPLRAADRSIALEILRQREAVGSTGIGLGVAIPHGRSTIFGRLMIAFGRSLPGISFQAVDRKKVHLFFLIVSPPIEVANQYHQVLASIVSAAKDDHFRKRLLDAESAAEVRSILGEAVF